MRIYSLLILLLVAQLSFATNVKTLFNEFRSQPKAEYVSVPPILMWIGRKFMDPKDKEQEIASRIRSIQVLDLESCSAKVKERFNRKVANLNCSGYETLIQVKEDGENVLIIAKEKNGIFKEFVVVCSGDEDCALILFKGNFREEDIAALAQQETEKRHGSN